MLPGWTAALLLVAAFDPPVNVSQTAGNSFYPTVAVEEKGPTPGAFRVLWHDFTPAPVNLGCIVNDGVGFGPPGFCPLSADASRTPRAATDALGRTHVVWGNADASGQREIFYARWDRVAWSAPVNLSNNAGRSVNPSIAVGPTDDLHVLWEDDSDGTVGFFEAHFDGVSWSAASNTGLPFQGGAFLDTIRVVADNAGTLHAVWHDGSTSLTEVFHAERPPAGSWSAADLISNSPAELSAEPSITVGPGDALHVVWVEQEPVSGLTFDVAYATRQGATPWSAPVAVAVQGANASRPVVAVGTDGRVQVAWTLIAGDREIFYVPRLGDPPENLSRSPGQVSEHVALALDPAGNPIVAWEEVLSGNREIYVARTASPALPIVLRLVAERSTGNAVLTWTGGLPNFHVERAADSKTAPFAEITPLSGIPGATWSDPVLADSTTYFYRVK